MSGEYPINTIIFYIKDPNHATPAITNALVNTILIDLLLLLFHY